ncbi:VOC family protein [Maribacter cobaltidurans]|jgi:predicted enzyme related to lactoylglutathione lyase|uniref:Uncharacterized protein n=1 Tax=Maribacter cobaltidurans TaxID=1178778 RepID=A0A223V4C0_9FLAO|nr:VOC family protein [Maribacter cobaltidurans]ASV29970.1 hypothetical protein CJ263_06900 [Maribacter cobaltidurans]GGD88254.1 glyoxalase [Maribacter cobaltidurans]
MKHAIQNFQIPVIEFDRALKFYTTVMGYDLQIMEFQGAKMAIFRYDTKDGVGGTIIEAEWLEPSDNGTLVYLQAGEDLQPFLDRVSTAGGKELFPKTELGPGMGFFGIFKDTEGNRVGLYSKK